MGYFLTGFFTAITNFLLKLFGKKATKAVFFTAYLALLIAVLSGVKDFVIANVDTSSFMTPTICFFLTKLHAFALLSSYFAFASANWLKAKTVQFWTSGN